MGANWEKKEGNQGVLTVDVDAKRFEEALDEAFKKVRKEVTVPGFRKGKVPRKVFEQRFGVEALYQDAVDIVLPEAYAQAVEDTGIEPVDQPEIEIEEIERGKNFVFKATVTVKPEVKLGEYKGLEVEEFDTTVTDEEVEESLKRLQEQHAELIVVEDGTVEEGDTVVIDFKGYVDGEPFEGGEAENYSLEIGSGQFIPGFEDQLVGLKPGDEKEVKVTFPEEYHAENLAGKDAVFEVKVHDLKRKEIPELDDEFAKDVDEDIETLAELREKRKEALQKEKEHAKEHHERDTVVEKAAENATIDIPEVMITNEVERMVQEFEQRLQVQGLALDMYYQATGTDEEGMKEQFKPEAEKRVKMNLTLEAIAKAENIEVTDEDVDKEIEKMAEMYGREADEIRNLLTMQGGPDVLKDDLKIQKAIDFLVEHSKTVPKKEDENEKDEKEE